ncbi:formylglycine-generating enzyme family protein [Candidatus Venteria ishoeyi]|uniref:formylglycine-generating enzyme family protein n=1 Tax=Candidatus Venteria ishoeyi TaxID=1899563 RepID=UPI0025A65477|nr:formylglycine-generating enzyme family protein [Candidatus Venteria ishoeyi]MDM8548385.1 formylglycine-generating enzyme family protein [Candidatus Venteria ishoeyi]
MSHPLSNGIPPAWADAWGQDEYGGWVAFEFDGISQLLRWIPPGEFLMGSPESEQGRYDWEIQHQVTLTQGFWLFDTPVTQALWQAVMGENPSRFQSPQRPVENVSWNDAQEFIKKLNDGLPGLELCLPSEAQWEHACRAGIKTATYAGDLKILGEGNAPLLDKIAWYGGNSGVDFELENGYDSSDWKEKQYEHKQAGTHPVALKQPNSLGLYDMLGNVWEWCEDYWSDSYLAEAQTDPKGPADGDSRVIRGGSWFGGARGVRAACRNAGSPDYRDAYRGFRCARVQA